MCVVILTTWEWASINLHRICRYIPQSISLARKSRQRETISFSIGFQTLLKCVDEEQSPSRICRTIHTASQAGGLRHPPHRISRLTRKKKKREEEEKPGRHQLLKRGDEEQVIAKEPHHHCPTTYSHPLHGLAEKKEEKKGMFASITARKLLLPSFKKGCPIVPRKKGCPIVPHKKKNCPATECPTIRANFSSNTNYRKERGKGKSVTAAPICKTSHSAMSKIILRTMEEKSAQLIIQ